MTNAVLISENFKKEIKPLAKKYRTLRVSVDQLISEIIGNPYLGVSYGADLYKVRLSDKSKGGGKSGGFRVMYYHLKKSNDGIEILMISIFDKSDKATIKKDEVLKQLKFVLDETK